VHCILTSTTSKALKTLTVDVVEEEVSKELFYELAFVHYNNLKSLA
jgi:hypothetical protein